MLRGQRASILALGDLAAGEHHLAEVEDHVGQTLLNDLGLGQLAAELDAFEHVGAGNLVAGHRGAECHPGHTDAGSGEHARNILEAATTWKLVGGGDAAIL